MHRSRTIDRVTYPISLVTRKEMEEIEAGPKLGVTIWGAQVFMRLTIQTLKSLSDKEGNVCWTSSGSYTSPCSTHLQ